MRRVPFVAAAVTVALAQAYLSSACVERTPRPQDVAQQSPELRQGYALFTHRCSKCHALSRPLDANLEESGYVAKYVRRMRLQPGSGILESEEGPIVDFLVAYAEEVKRTKAKAREPDAASSPGVASDAGARDDAAEGGSP